MVQPWRVGHDHLPAECQQSTAPRPISMLVQENLDQRAWHPIQHLL
jgi:hypothetical protein